MIITTLFSLLLLSLNAINATQPMHITNDDTTVFEAEVVSRKHEPVKCLTLVIGSHPILKHTAHIIQQDLEFSDQIAMTLNHASQELATNLLTKLPEQGYALCLYLEEVASKKTNTKEVALNVVLKDPTSGNECFRKPFTCKEVSQILDAHRISNELIPVLTGEASPALSSLAYCKQLSSNHKVVCISDYLCKAERTVVQAHTINVAPCWHSQAPVLFYSQFTRTNSRLMSYDLRNKFHNIVCSYDGLNMQPTFSGNGTQAVLCLSEKGNSELYFYDQTATKKSKKRHFEQLTHNNGNNTSPSMLANGNVVFCSDYQTGLPQIYLFDMKHKKTERLTNGKGYCASPTYCAKTDSIVYTRYAKGVFQLFSMKLNDPKHKELQITATKGDKIEPTISECGRYVAFTYADRNTKTEKITNQIAVINRTSGKMRVLTSGKEHKSFPSWTSHTRYA